MNETSPRYFIPIKVTGYIEVFAEAEPIVHVDRYDWDYAPYPDGTDEHVVIVHVGDEKPQITIEADANIVDAVRSKVSIEEDAVWRITTTADADIFGGEQ